jgi:hypothetical protein
MINRQTYDDAVKIEEFRKRIYVELKGTIDELRQQGRARDCPEDWIDRLVCEQATIVVSENGNGWAARDEQDNQTNSDARRFDAADQFLKQWEGDKSRDA